MPKLINIDKLCEDLPEITTQATLKKAKFHPDGLFSEVIFGPVKNYTCECGIYHGPSREGGKCDKCKVDIVNSSQRRYRYAKIVLPIPLVNPIFLDLFKFVFSKDAQKVVNELMVNENSAAYYDDVIDEWIVVTSMDALPKDVEYYEGTDAIEKVMKHCIKSGCDMNNPREKLLKENMDCMFIHNVLVLPPDLRPASKSSQKDRRVDKINDFYLNILADKLLMESTKMQIDSTHNKTIFYDYFKKLQKHVNDLYEHIISKLSGKEGLIRLNILGKRIDFSGRAVIVPSNQLRLDECSLPYVMVLELFRFQISKKLIEHGIFKNFNKALEFVDECIKTNNFILYDLCRKVTKNEVCILNRQPTLHRLGIVGFKVKVNKDNVIKINPLVCSGFNADFDGDTMAVYVPLTIEAKQEVSEKILSTKNLTSPNNGSLSMIPSQDVVFGIYALSKGLVSPPGNSTINVKGVEMTGGMSLINACFPEDYPPITGTIDKKRLIEILSDIRDKYSDEITAAALHGIKLIGFKFATYYGITMSLFDCVVEGSEELKDEIYSEKNSKKKQLEMINSEEVKNYLQKNFAYADIIDSGARGSWDQVRQMVFSRGFISNFDGEIISEPIKNSLIHGLTSREFFNSTYGCRKGLLDVALNTGVSGFLSRKLIFSCVNIQLGDDEDCGTTDYLPVIVKDIKKAKMLIGKYFKSNLKNKKLRVFSNDDCEKFVGKTIYVRSPIYCKNPKVCRTCYGQTCNNLKSEYIGVVAAQALGEANTQLVLRTFHTSGVAQIKESESENDQTFAQQDIIADLSAATSLFHRMDRNTTEEELVSKLFDVYNTSRTIYHIHFETVVAQLMWHGDTKWRLLKDREKYFPTFKTVTSVPSQESWMLGMAFGRPKLHMLKGIFNSGLYMGIMDKLLIGEKL